MTRNFRSRTLSATTITAITLLAVGLAFARKQFVMPLLQPAASYPAHDAHSDEKVTLAADAYTSADIFSIKWEQHDMLPVLVIVTNDGDQPISLSAMKVQFIAGSREKLDPATNDDLYRRLSNPKDPHRKIPLPIPLPSGKVKSSVSADVLDEIDRSQFAAKAIEPHTTRAGFFYFDVSGIARTLPGSRVYINGIRNAKGEELFYFEVAVGK